jgi:anti-sigma factor ChrR (cupin superfamily)
MSAAELHEEIALQAALYALGCLPNDEVARLEEHLAGCPECAAATRELEEAATALSALAPEADPPAGLRERLLERVAAPRPGGAAEERAPAPSPTQFWKRWADRAAEGPGFVPAGATGWEPVGVPGVLAKGLFVDASLDRVTMLVRIAPGSSFPPHRHGGPEECYVLEGDLDDGETRLRAGDYLRKDPGSVHGLQSSERGCVMLIVSSLHDELLPNPDA